MLTNFHVQIWQSPQNQADRDAFDHGMNRLVFHVPKFHSHPKVRSININNDKITNV